MKDLTPTEKLAVAKDIRAQLPNTELAAIGIDLRHFVSLGTLALGGLQFHASRVSAKRLRVTIAAASGSYIISVFSRTNEPCGTIQIFAEDLGKTLPSFLDKAFKDSNK